MRSPPVSGSIPACAGEPAARNVPVDIQRVYPRVRGGTAVRAVRINLKEGLSPRARGNLPGGHPRGTGRGSIPACAGEPRLIENPEPRTGVYPRVRGGTGCQDTVAHCRKGLSPRARGNPRRSGNSGLPDGSIPACAGEPDKSSASRGLNRVYPRVRGVTASTPRPASSPAGLSPRARGNPPFPAPRPDFEGSIPACAGEPCRRS